MPFIPTIQVLVVDPGVKAKRETEKNIKLNNFIKPPPLLMSGSASVYK